MPTAPLWEQPEERQTMDNPSVAPVKDTLRGQCLRLLRSILTPPSPGVTTLPTAPAWSPPAPKALTIEQRRGLLDGLRNPLQAGLRRALRSTSRGNEAFPTHPKVLGQSKPLLGPATTLAPTARWEALLPGRHSARTEAETTQAGVQPCDPILCPGRIRAGQSLDGTNVNPSHASTTLIAWARCSLLGKS